MNDIDKYISQYPEDIQQLLNDIRNAIRDEAPEAQECINYGIPTFKLNGNLVHFAAAKKHIGFFPAPSGISKFEVEIAKYKHAKGSVQFPIDEPLPLDLVRRIVKFRVEENLSKG